jgi:hypothetical protein
MLEVKMFEVRDRATFIAVVAILVDPAQETEVRDNGRYDLFCTEPTESEKYLLRRSGYGHGNRDVLLTRLDGEGKARCDPYAWCDQTMGTAHVYIQAQWSLLTSGDVVDVEFLLKETVTPKVSEQGTV